MLGLPAYLFLPFPTAVSIFLRLNRQRTCPPPHSHPQSHIRSARNLRLRTLELPSDTSYCAFGSDWTTELGVSWGAVSVPVPVNRARITRVIYDTDHHQLYITDANIHLHLHLTTS